MELRALASATPVQWDGGSATPYFAYRNSTTAKWHQVWYESTASIVLKRKLAQAMGLAGMGLFLADFVNGSDASGAGVWRALIGG